MDASETTTIRTALKLHAQDNVATALRDLPAGERPVLDNVVAAPTMQDDIARGHKFALRDIPADGDIIKYGQTIGIARTSITAGSHVHLHNIEGLAGRAERRRAKP